MVIVFGVGIDPRCVDEEQSSAGASKLQGLGCRGISSVSSRGRATPQQAIDKGRFSRLERPGKDNF